VQVYSALFHSGFLSVEEGLLSVEDSSANSTLTAPPHGGGDFLPFRMPRRIDDFQMSERHAKRGFVFWKQYSDMPRVFGLQITKARSAALSSDWHNLADAGIVTGGRNNVIRGTTP
jgi:hypothetical protein